MMACILLSSLGRVDADEKALMLTICGEIRTTVMRVIHMNSHRAVRLATESLSTFLCSSHVMALFSPMHRQLPVKYPLYRGATSFALNFAFASIRRLDSPHLVGDAVLFPRWAHCVLCVVR